MARVILQANNYQTVHIYQLQHGMVDSKTFTDQQTHEEL